MARVSVLVLIKFIGAPYSLLPPSVQKPEPNGTTTGWAENCLGNTSHHDTIHDEAVVMETAAIALFRNCMHLPQSNELKFTRALLTQMRQAISLLVAEAERKK